MSLGRLTVEASSLAVINDLVKQADLMSRMPQEGAALRQILRLETPLPSALLSWFTIAVIMWLQAAHEGPPYLHASSVMCAYASIISFFCSSLMWMRSATAENYPREWNVAGAGFNGIGAAFAIGAISFPDVMDKGFIQINADASQGYGWVLSALLLGGLLVLRNRRHH